MDVEYSPYMTIFEFTKIIQIRAKQLSLGEKPKIPYTGNQTVVDIAREEIERGFVNIKFKRQISKDMFIILDSNTLSCPKY